MQSDEPGSSPMSRGDARVSGTAPTYCAVDALDECPNTPDNPTLSPNCRGLRHRGKKRRRDRDGLPVTAASGLLATPAHEYVSIIRIIENLRLCLTEVEATVMLACHRCHPLFAAN
jgi:hypothetical protein